MCESTLAIQKLAIHFHQIQMLLENWDINLQIWFFL